MSDKRTAVHTRERVVSPEEQLTAFCLWVGGRAKRLWAGESVPTCHRLRLAD